MGKDEGNIQFEKFLAFSVLIGGCEVCLCSVE